MNFRTLLFLSVPTSVSTGEVKGDSISYREESCSDLPVQLDVTYLLYQTCGGFSLLGRDRN